MRRSLRIKDCMLVPGPRNSVSFAAGQKEMLFRGPDTSSQWAHRSKFRRHFCRLGLRFSQQQGRRISKKATDTFRHEVVHKGPEDKITSQSKRRFRSTTAAAWCDG